MTETLRVGTRRSVLARRQTALVLHALRRADPTVRFRVVPLVTQGDRSPATVDGLDFTDTIDRALEEGRIDIAVHSAKDLPVRTTRAVTVAAFPRRADPRDGLVLRRSRTLRSLAPGARIGSSSARRRAQLLRARSDLEVVEVRGNVDSRLALVRRGTVDGVILAVAGLERIGRIGAVTEVLDRQRFLPAPGQGALAVATRSNDRDRAERLAAVDDPSTRAAVTAERAFVDAIGGDCDTPLGALARVRGGELTLRAEVLSVDGRRAVGGVRVGGAATATVIGVSLARDLLDAGAGGLLGQRGVTEG